MVHESLIKEVDIPELVTALRYCANPRRVGCGECAYNLICLCRQKAMTDAAAAIEALQAEVKDLKRLNMELFNDLPKLGEWIYKPKDAIEMMFTLPKCYVCGHESSDANNYCPNCGAKMEVQE